MLSGIFSTTTKGMAMKPLNATGAGGGKQRPPEEAKAPAKKKK
jgi:hypothetical protein